MNHLELKSPHDGSLLTFSVTHKFEDAIDFNVQVKTPCFSGSAPSSTFMAVPLEEWFKNMVDDWDGWKGEKKWGDLESRVLLRGALKTCRSHESGNPYAACTGA